MTEAMEAFDGELDRFEMVVLCALREREDPDGEYYEPDISEVPIDELILRCDEAGVWSRGFADTAPRGVKVIEVRALLADWDRRCEERCAEFDRMWQSGEEITVTLVDDPDELTEDI